MTVFLLGRGRRADGLETANLVESVRFDEVECGFVVEAGPPVAIHGATHRVDPADRGMVKTPIEDPGAPPPSVQEGVLVAHDRGCGWPDGEATMVRLVGPGTVLGRPADDGEAAAMVSAWLEGVPGMHCVTDRCELDHAADAERANREPHEALIASWSIGEERRTVILAGKGSYMFFNDEHDCRSAAVEEPEADGLFRLHDASVSWSRDWESGIIDDWCLEGTMTAVKPTEAAAMFGTTIGDMIDAVEDGMDGQEPGTGPALVSMLRGYRPDPPPADSEGWWDGVPAA